MKFSWLLSFVLLDLSINQIIPTTNNPRFCMMIVPKRTSLKPTHQKTLVCVIIFFLSPTCTIPNLTYTRRYTTLHYSVGEMVPL